MNAFSNVSIFLVLLVLSLVFSSSEAHMRTIAVDFACQEKMKKDKTISDCENESGCTNVREVYTFSLRLTKEGKTQLCTGVTVWMIPYNRYYTVLNEGSCKYF